MPMNKMTISPVGVDFLIRQECPDGNIASCLKAYLDVGRVWTIGVGTTRYPDGREVKPGDKITVAQAKSYLTFYLEKTVIPTLQDHLFIQVNQNQFDALASLTYNIGSYALARSTLLDVINNGGSRDAIESQWLRWRFVKGKVSPGLVARRKRELALYYLTGCS